MRDASQLCIRNGAAAALLCLMAGCASLQPDESSDTAVTPTPAKLACAGAVKEKQGSCSANLLRAGEQGPECSTATKRIISNCQQAH
jgi:hypothetical protein